MTTGSSFKIIAHIVRIRRTAAADQTAGNHRGGAYSRCSFVEGEVASTRQVVAVVGAPHQCCPAWLVGEVLLNMYTPHVQGVDATGMFDPAVVPREGKMTGLVEVVVAESDHYRSKSLDQRMDRAVAELGQPHRVFVRVEQANMNFGVTPGRAAIVRAVGG